MLRAGLTLLVFLFLPATAVVATPPAAADSTDTSPWFMRNITRWFASRDPALSASPIGTIRRAETPFLPEAGRRIRQIEIRDRKAFGTVVGDSSAGQNWLLSAVRLTTSPLEAALNSLYTGTRPTVAADYLLFHVGDLLDPFALADTERLLREAAFTYDVRIEVFPAADGSDAVDVVVLVRDRWPYGADLVVKESDRYDLTLFHRNLLGRGIDLETRLLFDAGHVPRTGHQSRLQWSNLQGTLVDARLAWRRAWDRDERSATLARRLRTPSQHVVGGLGVGQFTDRTLQPEAPGAEVVWRTYDAWAGRVYALGRDEPGRRPRRRVVPALSVGDVAYVRRPDVPAEQRPLFLDHTQYLVGATLIDWESYRTSLVLGYGETEDIPAGLLLSFVGGFETCECHDRLYHGVSLRLARVLADGGYLNGRAAWGAYRRQGRVEDGVFDVRLGAFSRLRQAGAMLWRHFLEVAYTRGLNRSQLDGITLEGATGVRELDTDGLRGNQRLQASLETVAFTPYSVLGFKLAVYAFADAGLLGDTEDALFDRRLATSLGLGLRIKNPGLAFPTLQVQLANVHSQRGWDALISVGSGDGGLVELGTADVRPAVVPYR